MLTRIAKVALMNLRSLPARWSAAAVVVICLAGTAGVMVSMLAMAEGFQKTFRKSGSADRVIVLSTGETQELGSSVTRAQLPLLLGAPGLKRLADGSVALSVERLTASALPMASGKDGQVALRGVGAQVLGVRPEVRIVAGRMFGSGLREMVVGRAAQGQFPALRLGAEVSLSGVNWTVVGIFATGGSAHESEAWADVEVVMSSYNQSAYNSVTAVVDDAAAFRRYKDAITSDPGLAHTPLREAEYYAMQGGTLAAAMRIVGYVVAAIMALGALFAAVNTMYASVDARGVEIATLRAIGFDRLPIVLSVLLECVLLCTLGALLGGAAAYVLFNGYTVSTLGGSGFSQISFAFSVSPPLLLQGTAWACLLGLLGGLFPAVRAVRTPIIEGLRAA